jgi:Flp pilus assembly protein TadD
MRRLLRSLPGFRVLRLSGPAGAVLLGLVLAAVAWASARTRSPQSRPNLERLRTVAAASPSPAVLRSLVQRCLDEGKREEALSTAQRFVKLYPQVTAAHNALGIAFAENGDPLKARAEFETAIRLDPRAPDPYANLGWLAFHLGDNEQAISHFDRATAVAPNSARAWRGMGEAAAALHYTSQATDAFQKAIRLAPDRVEPYASLGSYLAESGHGLEARPYLERALKGGYRTGKLYASLAMAYADQPEGPDDLKKALEFAHQADLLKDGSSLLHYARGLALQRLGRYREAIQAFRIVTSRSATSNGAWIGMSQCYRALGRRKEADEAAVRGERILTTRQRIGGLQRQIRTNPDRLDLREEYAQLMMDNGNYLLAADQYRYVAAHRPDRPQEWLKVARALELGGKPDIGRYLRDYVRAELASGESHTAAGDSRPAPLP